MEKLTKQGFFLNIMFLQTRGIQTLKLLTLMFRIATAQRTGCDANFFFFAQDEITFPGKKKRVHTGSPPVGQGGPLGRLSGGFPRRHLAAPPLVRGETPVRQVRRAFIIM